MNSFHRLRQERLAKATKPFNARGAQLIRCERCLLSVSHCICHLLKSGSCQVDWILLIHRDEVLKPTNTGRLIAELFPSQTHIFEWSRTEPPAGIEELISDPMRQVLLVFPCDNAISPRTLSLPATQSQLRLTLILLDGTWKQARKMFNKTPWLAGLRSISPSYQAAAQYALRKAAHANCLSTAEAAILLMEDLDPDSAHVLSAVFNQFNQGYALSRGIRPQEPPCLAQENHFGPKSS